MRLKQTEIKTIKSVAKQLFGEKTTVILFGSRTDETKRGGDIDLFIQCDRMDLEKEQYKLKIKFLVELKKIIGDQKVDVLVDVKKQSNGIIETVKKEGIELWLERKK